MFNVLLDPQPQHLESLPLVLESIVVEFSSLVRVGFGY